MMEFSWEKKDQNGQTNLMATNNLFFLYFIV